MELYFIRCNAAFCFFCSAGKTCYDNGQLQMVRHFDRNNKPTGIWEFYYENGKLQAKGEMVAGANGKEQPNGLWKSYYSNRALPSESNYINGKPVGLYISYHPDGKIATTGRYDGMDHSSAFEQYRGSTKSTASGRLTG